MKIKSKNIAKDNPSKKLKKESQEEIIANLQEEILQLKNQNRVLNNHLKAKDSYIYKKVSELKKEISRLENKNRTFDIELLRLTKRIESNSSPRKSQKVCAILAHKSLGSNAELIDRLGNKTLYLISFLETYKAQKKKL